MAEIDYKIRTASYSDRSHLANLLHFGAYLHQHLDWKPALDWIGSRPYLMIEKKGEILAALACPPELPEVAWIRLFSISPLINLDEAWQILLEAALVELSGDGETLIAALSLQNWFNELLERSKFEYVDDVVVLIWEKSEVLLKPPANKINIRPMYNEDLEIVEQIDHDAFDSIWKNSRESLELAYQQSLYTSVAEIEGEIIGYQFSTNSSMGGHLARLAVRRKMHGHGIGYLLVHDLLNHFSRQGVGRVTVNTQRKNTVSLALYSKAGFKITGESYRVYQKTID